MKNNEKKKKVRLKEKKNHTVILGQWVPGPMELFCLAPLRLHLPCCPRRWSLG